MNNKTMTSAKAILRDRNKRGARNALLLCLAILVVAGVAGIFHMPATAKTYQVTQLTCTAVPPEGPAYADFFVHIHNDDCFDANGNLVCPLPEVRPHRHTAECFVTTRTLICVIPKSDGHQHTADCYTRVRGDLICTLSTEPVLDEEGNVLKEGHVHTDECFAWTEELTCGLEAGEGAHHHDESCFETSTTLTCDQPEILLHTHTEDCYQKNEDGSIYVDEDGNTWLICGQLQVTEHVHGPECFTTYELDDGEPEAVFMEEETQPTEDEHTHDAEETEEAGEKNTDSEETDDADTVDTEDAGESTRLSTEKETAEEETVEETVSVSMPAQSFTGETDGVIVSVEAPEGAFPKGTTMVVSQVEMDDDTLSNVTGAVENGSDQKVVTAQAVDISFFDADQNLIEPKLPIKVSMKSAIVSERENVALVHLIEADTAETAENETTEAPVAPTAEVVTDVQVVENPDEDNEIQFESDAFSVYVLVGTETITTRYLTADGQTYLITVTCGPEAKVPEGSTLTVEEILQDSEEYANYLAQAESAVKAGTAAEVTNEAAEAPEEGTDSAVETESTGNGNTGRVSVTTARFFDITILDAEGNPVEPAAPVDVKIEYMEPAETAENYQVVHFGAETEVLNPAVSGTEGTATAFDFQTSSFSVFGVVGTKIIEADVLLSDGNLYTVSVIYDESANIPSGSSLRVVPFEEGTPEYEYARNSVLADKKERGEWVDLSSFSLAALDISILNPDGEEIEPEAPVQVEIRIKELPGVEDLNEVAGTLTIQHHVEVEDGVVVETVFNGNAAAAFRMETNDTVAAEGTVVDPNSFSEEDFAAPALEDTDGLNMKFEADAFSTFTISWYNAYGNGTRIHYVDESGHELTVNNTTLPIMLMYGKEASNRKQ